MQTGTAFVISLYGRLGLRVRLFDLLTDTGSAAYQQAIATRGRDLIALTYTWGATEPHFSLSLRIGENCTIVDLTFR